MREIKGHEGIKSEMLDDLNLGLPIEMPGFK